MASTCIHADFSTDVRKTLLQHNSDAVTLAPLLRIIPWHPYYPSKSPKPTQRPERPPLRCPPSSSLGLSTAPAPPCQSHWSFCSSVNIWGWLWLRAFCLWSPVPGTFLPRSFLLSHLCSSVLYSMRTFYLKLQLLALYLLFSSLTFFFKFSFVSLITILLFVWLALSLCFH